MKTIKGKLSNLTVKSSKDLKEKTLTFKIQNTPVELTYHKNVNIKNGDNILVAGLTNRERVFKAFSYKVL